MQQLKSVKYHESHTKLKSSASKMFCTSCLCFIKSLLGTCFLEGFQVSNKEMQLPFSDRICLCLMPALQIISPHCGGWKIPHLPGSFHAPAPRAGGCSSSQDTGQEDLFMALKVKPFIRCRIRERCHPLVHVGRGQGSRHSFG